MIPKFSEMAKVCVRYENGPREGYVVAYKEQGERWLYKISHWDRGYLRPPKIDQAPPCKISQGEQGDPDPSWDNWVPEEWLEEVK